MEKWKKKIDVYFTHSFLRAFGDVVVSSTLTEPSLVDEEEEEEEESSPCICDFRVEILSKTESKFLLMILLYTPLKWCSKALSNEPPNKTFSRNAKASPNASSYSWSNASSAIRLSGVVLGDDFWRRAAILRVGVIVSFLEIALDC